MTPKEDLLVQEIRDYMVRMYQQSCDALEGWQEPRGVLVPSEPDPDQRRIIRAEHLAVCRTLEKLKNCVLLRSLQRKFLIARGEFSK